MEHLTCELRAERPLSLQDPDFFLTPRARAVLLADADGNGGRCVAAFRRALRRRLSRSPTCYFARPLISQQSVKRSSTECQPLPSPREGNKKRRTAGSPPQRGPEGGHAGGTTRASPAQPSEGRWPWTNCGRRRFEGAGSRGGRRSPCAKLGNRRCA